LKRPSIWNRKKGLLRGAELSRKSTLRSTKDARARRELGVGIVARSRDDGACKLGASNPGEGRLVLVFALDLENVKEVGGGGVDWMR